MIVSLDDRGVLDDIPCFGSEIASIYASGFVRAVFPIPLAVTAVRGPHRRFHSRIRGGEVQFGSMVRCTCMVIASTSCRDLRAGVWCR